MNILIADDIPTNLKLLAAILEADGHVVFSASDGVEALEVLKRRKIEAVISDILMPRLDGYRLCLELRRDPRFRTIPFVVYTNTYTSPGDETFARQVGADRFMHKPASAAEITKVISSLALHLDPTPPAIDDEMLVVKEFSERLVAKLEEKNAELQRQTEELRAAREQLNSFFSTATAGLCILDSQLRYVQINETLAAFDGLPAKDHLGKTIHEVIPQLAPRLERIFRRILATGKPALDVEVSGERPSKPGVLRHWLASFFPLSSGDSQALGAIVVEITDRKQAEAEVHRSREQLRALAAHLQVIREEERGRISREIHDVLGQNLTSLNLDVGWLQEHLARSEATLSAGEIRKRLKSMETLLQTSSRTVQRMASDLRPGMLDDFGITATLEWAAEDWAHRTGICCRWKGKPAPVGLNREKATALFRIFQEILTNISRHARAHHVTCRFKTKTNDLTLQVTDDGRGFNPSKLSDRKSLGLLGMRERALLLAGRVEIQSAPGKGTTVTVCIPLAPGSKKRLRDPKKRARKVRR
jgi:PAS domain S-box-containing protein